MEKFMVHQSLKDIPVPGKRNYLLLLTSKMKNLISRMRWKTFFNNQETTPTEEEKFGFKSQKNPPPNKLLEPFEEELLGMVNNIQFRTKKSNYQNQLTKLVKEIQNSDKVFVKADKTNNFYKMSCKDYNKLLTEAITKDHKKVQMDIINQEEIINKEAKSIAQKLKIEDRVGVIEKKAAYILVKDHKPQFPGIIETRLINPTRTEIGSVSKKILDRVNHEIKSKLQLKQWICTKEAINWFKNIDGKKKAVFVQFDIVNFYPSITKTTFLRAIAFAKRHSTMTDYEIEIVMKCRRTLLYKDEQQWMKKSNENEDDFGISMGSLDSAQASDMVGLFILHELTALVLIEDIGLYRDDGLLVIRNGTRYKCDKVRRFINRVFNRLDLKVDIGTNLKVVNFLDVTFDLTQNTYEPYRKENTITKYVNVRSNHPPTIINQIPKSITTRLNDNSSNEEVFNKNKEIYNIALKKSGYNENLQYDENIKRRRRRKKKNKTMWFTPPFSLQTKTNVGKQFLRLVDKHFHPNHPLRKLFNRTNLKVSYSCTENLEKIIKNHNRKIIKKSNKDGKKRCNCKNKVICPLGGSCLKTNIVYLATISSEEEPEVEKYYIGMTKNQFKTRLASHKYSFKNDKQKGNTELSKWNWYLKSIKQKPIIKWKILAHAPSCNNLKNNCMLCESETLEILKAKSNPNVLNKRNEINTKCVHRKEFQLMSYENK